MKVSFLILAISFFITFSSCVSDEVSIPDHVIQRDTLIELLAEIQIMEALQQITADRQKLEFDIIEGYEWELEKYNVSKQRFITSMEFYSRHQNLFEDIYSDVIIRITEIEAEFTSKNQN